MSSAVCLLTQESGWCFFFPRGCEKQATFWPVVGVARNYTNISIPPFVYQYIANLSSTNTFIQHPRINTDSYLLQHLSLFLVHITTINPYLYKMEDTVHPAPAVKAGGMRVSQAAHPHIITNASHTVPIQSGVTIALEPSQLSISPSEKRGKQIFGTSPPQHPFPTREQHHNAPRKMPIQQPR